MLPTPSMWTRIKSLFVRARDSSDPDRFLSNFSGSAVSEVRRMIMVGSDFQEHFTDSLETTPPEEVDRQARWLFSAGMQVARRFEIVRPVGRGGMGEIYEARDQVKDVLIALKVVLPNPNIDPKLADRLLRREFALAQMISHPNVCRIFDPYLHEDEGGPMLVVSMELLRGKTLASVLHEQNRLSVDAVISIARQLAAGIDAAHSVGVVHRDLKPANIILVHDGEKQRAVITDFGLARRVDQSVTQLSKAVAGTLRYMAPEQIQGRADKRSDLYTFAIVLYELVTGELPFSGDSDLSIALKRLTSSPRDPGAIVPGIPIAWRVALLRGLSRDPEGRFQTAGELIQAIDDPPIAPLLYQRMFVSRLRALPYAIRWTIALAVIAAGGSSMLYLKPSVPPFPRFSRILIADLHHESTEDSAVLGADASLAAALGQSPHLTVARVPELAGTITKMGVRPDSGLSDEMTRELAMRTGETAILYGSISKRRGYSLHIRVEAVSGDPRHAAAHVERDFQVADAAGVFGAVANAAAWVRKLSGEGATELNEQNARPEDLATSSWDALKLLQEARARRSANDPSAALIFAKEALDLDAGFAAAEAFIADTRTDLRQYKEAFAGYKRALDLARRRNVAGRERYQIEASYNIDAGDDNALTTTYAAWIAHFPRDYMPHFFLGFTRFQNGHYDDAIRELRRAEELDPHQFAVLPHLAEALLAKDQFSEAQHCAEQLRALGEDDWALEVEALILLAQHHFEAAATKVAPISSHRDGTFPSVGPRYVASALADAGRLRRAEEALSKADTDGESNSRARSADRQLQLAFLSWLQHDNAKARAALATVGDDLDNPDSLSLLGILYARLGDLQAADFVLQKLDDWPRVPLVARAAERIRTEMIAVRRPKSRRVASLSDLDGKSPLDLESLLYASVLRRDGAAAARLKQEIRNRKDILLSWDGRHAPLGLYWLATCEPDCYPKE